MASYLGMGMADGSVSDPAISFQNAPTTGIYRDGSGNICFAVSGAKVFAITAAGEVQTDAEALTLTGTTVTTGTILDISSIAALTTGKAINVVAAGATQTSGILVNIASDATGLTGAGRLLQVNHTGAAGVSGTVVELKSAAADETIICTINATGVLALGRALDVSVAAMTTGTGIKVTPTAMTTGNAVDVSSMDALTTGIGLNIASAATAITGAGRMVYVNHTGVTGTSATLVEVASAANDETIIAQITASAALALGVAFKVSGAAVTTGTLVDASNANALTTGRILNLASNSADTSTRSLAKITNTNALATGTTPLEVNNGSTGAAIKITGNVAMTGIDFTAIDATHPIFNATAGSGSTAAPQTNAPTGFIKIKVAGVDQWLPYYSAT